MINRRSKRWLFGAAALLLAAPPLALWLLAPKPEPLQPIVRFLPDRLAAAARVGDLAGAWQRHWVSRGGTTTPESALQDWLDAQGKWEKMVAKHGELAAQARVKLIPHFLFNTIGQESWVFFGEWDGAGPSAAPKPSAEIVEKARQAAEAKAKKAKAKAAAKKLKAAASAKTGSATTSSTSATVAKSSKSESAAPPATFIPVDDGETSASAILAAPESDAGGMVGLVMILPGGGSVKTVVGPLVELLLDKESVVTVSRVSGTTVYQYESLHARRCLAFASIGGRIVISLRRRGMGPLPAIIAHVRDAAWTPPSASDAAALTAAPGDRTKGESIFATLHPALVLEQVARMNRQREKTPSKEARKTTRLWETRLAGLERLTLRQAGASLLDLDLMAERRPAAGDSTSSTTLFAKGGDGSTNRLFQPSVPAIEVDCETGALRDALARTAFDFKAGGINPMILELAVPGALAHFERALDRSGHSGERVGAALFPSSVPMTARVLTWSDRPPLTLAGGSPASDWAVVADGRTQGGRGDTARWQGSPAKNGDEANAPAWERFASASYADGTAPPDLFAALDFATTARILEGVPDILLKKDARKKLKSWQGLARGLALALGGASLRLDEDGDRSLLRLRTMASSDAKPN